MKRARIAHMSYQKIAGSFLMLLVYFRSGFLFQFVIKHKIQHMFCTPINIMQTNKNIIVFLVVYV